MTRTLQKFAPLLLVASLLSASAGPAVRIEKVMVNQPPETIITAGPTDSMSTTYRVWFYWSGEDLDGVVDHFDFILVDHPASHDSIGPGGANPVVVSVPDPEDPRWTSTVATDSVFVTLADTLRRDPRPGLGETTEDVLRHPFDRWHTFFVRAVDNDGTPDATPAYRSFNAQTLAPTVHLLAPVQAGADLSVPPVVTFSWDGEDPVGDSSTIEPVASRYVIIDSRIDISRPDSKYVSYPDSLYVLPNRFDWSPWRAWDLPDGTGRQAVISGLSRVGEAPGSGYYIFAVQAMDEAGAITPVFDFESPGRNNVALVRVSGSLGPYLQVREPALGMQVFVDGSNPIALDIAAEQTLRFQWSADASRYGGIITDYRYGWDIQNPDHDEEWSAWSPTTVNAPPRSFSSGSHRFSLQARDNAESITGATYDLNVHTLTQSRDVLLVDDSDFLTDYATEVLEDARWNSILQQVTADGDLLYDPELDIYDVQANQLAPPGVDKIFDYKAVIWNTRSGREGSSGLRRLAQFYDPVPQRYQNTAKSFNVLSVYIANGGRLWISGFRPAQQLWPDERARGSEGAPVNVTDWNDPIEPHPGIDSVGTASLLYRMGIEMFDVGSALIQRSRREQFCYGLRAASVDAPELQVGSGWGQAGGAGRSNIEIYDMPFSLANEIPPLVPPAGKTRVLYTYVSGVQEDPGQGILYPETADNQPVFVLSKTSVDDAYYSMAFCGFEPYLLESNSHVQLARYVLLQEMGLAPVPIFLRELTAIIDNGSVQIHWQVDGDSFAEFLLRARTDEAEWNVPFAANVVNGYTAMDDSPHLADGGPVTYTLYAREADSSWAILGERTLTLFTPPPSPQLLAPQPNPFNPNVTIGFVLPDRQRVRLGIFTVEGRRVVTLLDEVRPAGASAVIWDGIDMLGSQVPSGLYLVRLETTGVRLSRKLVLMK